MIAKLKRLELECGEELQDLSVAYETWGTLNEARDNTIVVCHALTGHSTAADTSEKEGWWQGLVGQGLAIDTNKYFVVCANVLGSCYGTTGPGSINSKTGKAHGIKFPAITIRDMVKVYALCLDQIGIKRIHTVIGGSLGGMMVLEWGAMYPEKTERLISIAACAQHPAWATAWNEIQRQAIRNDPAWQKGAYVRQPSQGLALARMAAMISYRSAPAFEQKFSRKKIHGALGVPYVNEKFFEVESYLHYQGNKLVKRFDANSYLYLTRAMDSHDLARGRGVLKSVLNAIRAKTLCVGISSDVLYPCDLMKSTAKEIPNGTYAEIDTEDGHDAFLIAYEQLNFLVKTFLENYD